MLVDSLMRRDVTTVDASASVRAAAGLMRDRGIDSLVVVTGGRPVGILTDRDIAMRVVAAGLAPDETAVLSVASAPLATVSPDTSVDVAAEKMKALRIKRLVVVADGVVRGILSVADIAYSAPGEERRRMDQWVKARWQD